MNTYEIHFPVIEGQITQKVLRVKGEFLQYQTETGSILILIHDSEDNVKIVAATPNENTIVLVENPECEVLLDKAQMSIIFNQARASDFKDFDEWFDYNYKAISPKR